MLELGEIEGGQEFQLAVRQGHAEGWANEHLREVIEPRSDLSGGRVVAVSMGTIGTAETSRDLPVHRISRRVPS